MKKLIIIILSFISVISCTSLDQVWEELREHEERIERLETECQRLNSNIEALQAVLEAMQANDYITDITRITEAGIEIGYSITFAKSGTVNIYHGADGADGSAPKIGIRKAADGEYYWTSDDGWLTDEQGEKNTGISPGRQKYHSSIPCSRRYMVYILRRWQHLEGVQSGGGRRRPVQRSDL